MPSATDKKKVEPYPFSKSTVDYSNDPFFIKKRKEAEEFIKKYGLPEPSPKSSKTK